MSFTSVDYCLAFIC